MASYFINQAGKKVIKKIFVLYFLFILQITSAIAVELVITNDISDIIESKKICARLNLNADDQAIYSNSLIFSIDSPYLEIASWSCSKNPSIQYVHTFKRTKKVYTEPPSYEVLLRFNPEDEKTALKNLCNSSLYASCIVLGKNGISNATILVKSLDDGFSIIDTLTFDNKITYNSVQTFTKNFLKHNPIHPNFINPGKPPIDSENLMVDNLKGLWNKLAYNVTNFFLLLNRILSLIIIFALFIFLILLKLKRNSMWVTELLRFMSIGSLIWGYSFLRFIIKPHIFFSGFAILITPVSFYYIFTSRTGSMLSKLKSFIGLVLAALIIPFLVKACISLIFF